MSRLTVWAVEGMGEVRPGDQLGELVADACAGPPNGPFGDGGRPVPEMRLGSEQLDREALVRGPEGERRLERGDPAARDEHV